MTPPPERGTIELLPGGRSVGFDRGEITFIGTATVLLRYAGFTILTDPNFLHAGEHAYLGLGLRSRRLTSPAMEISDLPAVDFVVLSHHHGDHFDRVAAEELDKDIPIITEAHGSRKLRSQGFRASVALETWQSQVVARGRTRVRVTAMPGKHAPRPLGALLPPVMGSLLEFQDGDDVKFRLYITGDTLLHERLHEVPRRHPDIDLCLIHLGGTRVAGILLTMDADQGVAALQLVRPRSAMPVHYDDYTVFKSPLEDFKLASAAANLDTKIHYIGRGETCSFEPNR
ncbi:MAG TPA: MBL fold metallo-hydrolase [Acidimicrobiales bacterium]|nr:MBL fold metallo-hydrolase [Acidimicrobiales bacterium]